MKNLCLLLTVLFVAGCAPSNSNTTSESSNNILIQNCITSTGDASITGNITLVSNEPLTNNSFTIISIVDAYSALPTLGTSCTSGVQSSPFAYQVFYSTQDVYANNSYSVSVNIYEKFDGENYYIRDKSIFIYPVITNGAGTTVDLYAYSISIIN